VVCDGRPSYRDAARPLNGHVLSTTRLCCVVTSNCMAQCGGGHHGEGRGSGCQQDPAEGWWSLACPTRAKGTTTWASPEPGCRTATARRSAAAPAADPTVLARTAAGPACSRLATAQPSAGSTYAAHPASDPADNTRPTDADPAAEARRTHQQRTPITHPGAVPPPQASSLHHPPTSQDRQTSRSTTRTCPVDRGWCGRPPRGIAPRPENQWNRTSVCR
jgi:hypothetical protein